MAGKSQTEFLGMPTNRKISKGFQKFIATRRRWRGPRAQLVTLSVLPFSFVHVFNGYVACLSVNFIKTTTFKERS